MIYVIVRVKRGTLSVYFVSANVFRAIPADDVVHKTDAAGLLKVSARLLRGDIIDVMVASHSAGGYEGVTVWELDGVPTLTKNFEKDTQQSELLAFREVMAPLGNECCAIYGDSDEDYRTPVQEYVLPTDPEAVTKAIIAALDHLEGKSSEFYITGCRSAPADLLKKTGIYFRLPENPLAEILGASSLSAWQQKS